MKLFQGLFFFSCFSSAFVLGEDPCSNLGNLSLPGSQQPSTLVGFGQTVLDKGQAQLYLFGDAFIGQDTYTTDLLPYLVYGITDDLSLYFNFPFSPGNKSGDNYSSGLEDFYLQGEYSFYTGGSKTVSNQATLVGQVMFPTGSSKKNPATGNGSPSFFVGATFNRTEVKWFYFASPGARFMTSFHTSKFGNQFLYQFGIGRNIPSPCGWIFAWLLDVDGTFSQKNRVHGVRDPNSGGNVIYATPSLWFSSSKFIIQFGVGYPIVQNLFGNQLKNFISTDFQIGYTF